MNKSFSFQGILVDPWVLLTKDPAIYLVQFESPIYLSRQLCFGRKSTLVYQINVQHNLLFFQKNPTCMVLFHPAHFINFGNFSQFFDFYSNKIRKIPTCTALFHPAHFINFEEFSSLHVYSILHDYLID